MRASAARRDAYGARARYITRLSSRDIMMRVLHPHTRRRDMSFRDRYSTLFCRYRCAAVLLMLLMLIFRYTLPPLLRCRC